MTMREPRAGDINRYGNPVRVNSDGEIIIEERKMTYMIAALANILPPFIEDMDTRDWNSCAYRIRRFFSARTGRLVGDEDEIILVCYRLAKHYHVSPEVFLSMPVDEVLLHLHRTGQMEAEHAIIIR